MQANALRAGMCVLHNNEVCPIMSVTHRTPGTSGPSSRCGCGT